MGISSGFPFSFPPRHFLFPMLPRLWHHRHRELVLKKLACGNAVWPHGKIFPKKKGEQVMFTNYVYIYIYKKIKWLPDRTWKSSLPNYDKHSCWYSDRRKLRRSDQNLKEAYKTNMDMEGSSGLCVGVCDVACVGSRKSECFFFRRLVPQVFCWSKQWWGWMNMYACLVKSCHFPWQQFFWHQNSQVELDHQRITFQRAPKVICINLTALNSLTHRIV